MKMDDTKHDGKMELLRGYHDGKLKKIETLNKARSYEANI